MPAQKKIKINALQVSLFIEDNNDFYTQKLRQKRTVTRDAHTPHFTQTPPPDIMGIRK